MSYITVSAEVDVEDVIEDIPVTLLEKELKRRAPRTGLTVEHGMGEGDIQPQRYVESAFLAAKALPDCPQALKDMFWHVFGRAI